MVHKGSCRWQTYIVGDSFSVLSASEDDVPWAPPLSVWLFRILSGKKHTTFPIIYLETNPTTTIDFIRF